MRLWNKGASSGSRRLLVALLLCLLAAAAVAQAAHFHKNEADAHHACTVCAVHAPALAPAAILLPPPRSIVRAIHVDSKEVHYCVSTPTAFIRPPPSV